MIEIPKLQKLMRKIEAKHGPFTLFALLMREESPGGWDLVVAARWLERGKFKALEEFAREVADIFGVEHIGQILPLSRIVTLNRDDPALHAILDEVGRVSRPVEKQGHNLFGLPVEHAYVLKATPGVRVGAIAASAIHDGADNMRAKGTRGSRR